MEQSGKLAEAEPIYRKLSEMMPKLMGEAEHPITTRKRKQLRPYSYVARKTRMHGGTNTSAKSLKFKENSHATDHHQIAINFDASSTDAADGRINAMKLNPCFGCHYILQNPITIRLRSPSAKGYLRGMFEPTMKALFLKRKKCCLKASLNSLPSKVQMIEQPKKHSSG